MRPFLLTLAFASKSCPGLGDAKALRPGAESCSALTRSCHWRNASSARGVAERTVTFFRAPRGPGALLAQRVLREGFELVSDGRTERVFADGREVRALPA